MRPAADTGEVAVGMFHRHGHAVRRFLYRLTRNPAAADDLAGEVFLRVVQAAPAYEPREREAAWVFRIAQNVWRDANRRRVRSVEDARAADAASPARQVEGLDLQRGLDALPEDERVALLLGEMGGLSYAEIADATGSTVPAVRSRIYRARQTLRARLLPPPRAAAAPLRGSHDD
jgi:RNA polymerase sigma-70 factor (ECF subfamily)